PASRARRRPACGPAPGRGGPAHQGPRRRLDANTDRRQRVVSQSSTEKGKMKPTIEINESNFDTEVLNSSQPVLVDFWADWCGPCKMLAPVLDQIAAERSGRVKIGKVNVDENPALA